MWTPDQPDSAYVRGKNPAAARALMEAEQAFYAPTNEVADDVFEVVRESLLLAEWRFARTMPQNPHEYTLRERWDDLEFAYTVEAIRRYGEIEMFGRWPYITLRPGTGYYYWTMGYPISQTTLINRKPDE